MTPWCENELIIFGPDAGVAALCEELGPDIRSSLDRLVGLEQVSYLPAESSHEDGPDQRGLAIEATSGVRPTGHREGSAYVAYAFRTRWVPPICALRQLSERFRWLVFTLQHDSPGSDISGVFAFSQGRGVEVVRGGSFILQLDRDEYLYGACRHADASPPPPPPVPENI